MDWENRRMLTSSRFKVDGPCGGGFYEFSRISITTPTISLYSALIGQWICMRHIFIVGSHEIRCGKQIFSKLHILSFSEHISDNVNLHCFHSIKIEKNQYFLQKKLFSPQMDTIKKLYISQYWADLLHIFELNSFEG